MRRVKKQVEGAKKDTKGKKEKQIKRKREGQGNFRGNGMNMKYKQMTESMYV